MHSFFVPDLGSDVVELPDEEAGHVLRVLRLKDGEKVFLVDGQGSRVEAALRIAGKRTVTGEILQRQSFPQERASTIHLAVALVKQMERFEWMLEKCTEIGVDRITPLITSRTERSRSRHDRMARVLIAAMKQSQRTWLP